MASKLTDENSERAVLDLLDEYYLGFEAKRTGETWLRSFFTEDATVDFPVGTKHGLAEIAALQGHTLALWKSTLHQLGKRRVRVTGDQASLQATLTATHVHRDDDPGEHLHIGGYVDTEARRTPGGWRFTRMAIRLVWTQGDPPTVVE
ncbi:MAG TPA: nuclear transport factor 2 family protein [Pseudonocardiaceae bacterium]|nr:nuclear transport factor 2 family protein [Pseudonocardiaceae bacterium]